MAKSKDEIEAQFRNKWDDPTRATTKRNAKMIAATYHLEDPDRCGNCTHTKRRCDICQSKQHRCSHEVWSENRRSIWCLLSNKHVNLAFGKCGAYQRDVN